MEICIKSAGQVTVVEMTGDIDGKTVMKAQEPLAALVGPGSKILLDMSGVDYMSSAGLRMLLSLHRQVSAHNGMIALAGLSEELRDTMEVTGFLRFFTTYEAAADGVAALI